MNFNKVKIVAFLNKIEPYYFYLFTIINLLPVIAFKFFLIGDGPAHLYNSRLILELLNNNIFITDYFQFNQLSPNWFGHIILAVFLNFFPAFIAEKILILFYLIGFPLSFRALIKQLPFNNRAMFYFVFPFTYSFLFYLGMYNFHLGLVFFFWALALFIKYKQQYNFKRIVILLILSTLICLSHIFTFAIFILVILIFNLSLLKTLINSDLKTRLFNFKKIGNQILFLFPSIILMLNFIFTKVDSNKSDLVYVSPWTLLNWIIQIQPAKAVNYAKEGIFTRWILYLFLLIIIYLIAIKIFPLIFKEKQVNKIKPISSSYNWLFFSISSIILMFILPDGNSAFGFISSRLLLFFFLFLIVWLATQHFPLWLGIISFLIINYMNLALLKIYFVSTKNSNNISLSINEAANHIKPNSIILPLNYSDNMLFNHASNYLGIEKPLVILENYEATLNYFPLKWNINTIPNLIISNTNNCLNFPKNERNKKKYIDYIFILTGNEKDSSYQCEDDIKNILNSNYHLEYNNGDKTVLLYKLENKNQKSILTGMLKTE